MLLEPAFLSEIEQASLERPDELAVRLLEGLLGLDAALQGAASKDAASGDGARGYDAQLMAEAAAGAAERLMDSDVPRALLIRGALHATRTLRDQLRLPHNLGYRREAVRLATKIFDEIKGRRVLGHGPIVDALAAAGAVRIDAAAAPDGAALAIDIAVVRVESSQTLPPVTLAFEFGATCPHAAYRFSASDLVLAVRREMGQLYPKDMKEHVLKAARELAESLRAMPPSSDQLMALVAEIQSGVSDKYASHAPSEALFARVMAERLRAEIRSPEDALVLHEFLRAVVERKRRTKNEKRMTAERIR